MNGLCIYFSDPIEVYFVLWKGKIQEASKWNGVEGKAYVIWNGLNQQCFKLLHIKL